MRGLHGTAWGAFWVGDCKCRDMFAGLYDDDQLLHILASPLNGFPQLSPKQAKFFCGKRFAAWDAATGGSRRAKVPLNTLQGCLLKVVSVYRFISLLLPQTTRFCSHLSELILRNKFPLSFKTQTKFQVLGETTTNRFKAQTSSKLYLLRVQTLWVYEFTCRRTGNPRAAFFKSLWFLSLQNISE